MKTGKEGEARALEMFQCLKLNRYISVKGKRNRRRGVARVNWFENRNVESSKGKCFRYLN